MKGANLVLIHNQDRLIRLQRKDVPLKRENERLKAQWVDMSEAEGEYEARLVERYKKPKHSTWRSRRAEVYGKIWGKVSSVKSPDRATMGDQKR